MGAFVPRAVPFDEVGIASVAQTPGETLSPASDSRIITMLWDAGWTIGLTVT